MKALFKKRGKSKNIFFIILFLVIIISILLSQKGSFLEIKNIAIVGDQLSCADFNQIKEVVRMDVKNILFINEDRVKENVKKNFYCIGDIILQRKLPDELKVQVFKRYPVAVFLKQPYPETTASSVISNIVESTDSAELIFSKSVDSFLIDREGVLFEKSSGNLNLPKIYILDRDLSLGQSFDKNLIEKIIKIIEKLNLFGIQSGEFIILNEILVDYSSPKIIFKLDQTIETQLASLQLILEKAKIDSDVLEFIDLRFDKPIIRYGKR